MVICVNIDIVVWEKILFFKYDYEYKYSCVFV